jgi:asparagine synthase (glutamine-hydrolysing)
VPFLDHPFVEFAARVPASLKIRDGVGKSIFKRAVEDLLPRDIVYRKKMGFPTPIRRWLNEPHAAALLAGLEDRNGFLASYLDLSEVGRVVKRHRAGVEDATDRLWRLLNLNLWGIIFFGASVPSEWEDKIAAGSPT